MFWKLFDSFFSAFGIYGSFGIILAIITFFLVFGHGSIKENELHQGKIEPFEPKELTPEEDKKEGLQTLGCLLVFFIIALIIILWIM